jgi:hypothetical protein
MNTLYDFSISHRYESANVNLEFSEITSVEFQSNIKKKHPNYEMKLCTINDPDRTHTKLQQIANTITNLGEELKEITRKHNSTVTKNKVS